MTTCSQTEKWGTEKSNIFLSAIFLSADLTLIHPTSDGLNRSCQESLAHPPKLFVADPFGSNLSQVGKAYNDETLLEPGAVFKLKQTLPK